MSRSLILVISAMVLSLQVCAKVQQPLQPWRPTPFQPKAASCSGARPLKQSCALKYRLEMASDKKNMKNLRVQLNQRKESARAIAKRLEQTTEDSLTQGGSLRKAMEDANVEARKVDSTMKALRDAVPKMREAGRLVNRELDGMEGVK